MAPRLTALLIALLAGLALAVPSAQAIQAVPPVEITVNTTADESTDGDGLTSLREAIAQVNADSGSNTYDITLPAGTYHLGADGALDLTYTHGPVNLAGGGARSTIVTADGSHRVLQVGAGAHLTISQLTITGGQAPATAAGGGIFNSGSLTLLATTVSNNAADFGGGIANYGGLGISSSTLTGNSAGVGAATAQNPQPTWIGGGAIYHDGSGLYLNNDTIDGNTANGTDTVGGFGGGIHNGSNAAGIEISFTTFAHNRALGLGADGLDFASTVSETIPANDNLFASEPVGGASASSPHNCAGSNDLYGASGDDTLDTGSTCAGQAHADPKLQPLADNGGPTDTDALSSDSPAINGTGDCGPSGYDVSSDQRGLPRSGPGSYCDIGAYELQSGNDLALAIGATPDPVTSGANVTYTITASATGPTGDATQPTVTDSLPAGTSLVSATPSQGSCSGSATVTCALGSVHNGSSATVTLVVRAGAPGPLSDTATVSAPRPETTSSNNSASATVNVVPAPATANTNTNTSTNPGAAAALTALGLNPRSFRAAPSGASAARTTGTRVTYTLSHADKVTFTAERQTKGVRKGRKCVAPSRKLRHGKSCARYVRVRGSFSLQGKAGTNSFHFSGRIGGRTLAPGSYRLVATPAGAHSTPQRTSFKIVK